MMEDTVARMDNAYSKLIDVLIQYGAGEYAAEVADLYIKEKIAKLDVNIGSYKLIHGGALDSEVIKNAVKVVQINRLEELVNAKKDAKK